jgi:hypothetical protein
VTVSIYIFLICFAFMGTAVLAAVDEKLASSVVRRPVPSTVSEVAPTVYRRRIQTIISEEAAAESNRHTFLNPTKSPRWIILNQLQLRPSFIPNQLLLTKSRKRKNQLLPLMLHLSHRRQSTRRLLINPSPSPSTDLGRLSTKSNQSSNILVRLQRNNLHTSPLNLPHTNHHLKKRSKRRYLSSFITGWWGNIVFVLNYCIRSVAQVGSHTTLGHQKG